MSENTPEEEPATAEASAPSGFGRFLVVTLLLFAVGGFGLATLCGAVFTISGFQGGEFAAGMWVISVPSMLIGGWLTWLCGRQLARFLKRGA